MGSPSGPNATAELLFTPFFLMISGGGGIDDGMGVPLAAGVFEADSGGLSLFEAAAVTGGFEMVDEESFDGDSSLTGASENFDNFLGDSLRMMIFDGDDFRRAVELVESLLGGAIVV